MSTQDKILIQLQSLADAAERICNPVHGDKAAMTNLQREPNAARSAIFEAQAEEHDAQMSDAMNGKP